MLTKTSYTNKEAKAIKNRRFQKKGLRNASSESQALTVAKIWATNYTWEETVTKAYFTGNDWNIYRNSLTGRQLGQRI